ncbi:unnamed protein product [Hymenolepis diminuta]|uniref:Transposase n=1 Tax=Hymenolepis diminuta TaxID=6216 RepID=A0A0R3STJ7_HYMDI|nr:unnamed protein product [Hymenolepis diminuta]
MRKRRRQRIRSDGASSYTTALIETCGAHFKYSRTAQEPAERWKRINVNETGATQVFINSLQSIPSAYMDA